ncbi:2487_t:CDS:2, partial [Entrophospora sp. SA101]
SSSKDTKLDKAPIRLIEFFKLPSDTLFCNHCKYSSDHDETFQNYPHPASRPKFINGIKAEIGYMLDDAGASASAIETFAGAGISIRRETVTKHKKRNELIHSETVGEFVSEHMDDLMILNLDDYHNIHTKRRADTTTTSEVHHFQTILLKAAPRIPAPPFNNPFTDKNIHNPRGIDHNLIIENLQQSIFPYLWLTYNERKLFFAKNLHEAANHEEQVEMLLVHSYDNRIRQRREDRSMKNTKLVNLVEGSLHSTRDYVKAINNLLNVPELESYLGLYALPASLDYPGQFNLR